MDSAKKDAIMSARTFDQLLDAEYGQIGTPERDQFEIDAAAFSLAETLKEERLKAGLTQEQLAERIGTKKNLYFTVGEWQVRYSVKYIVPYI